MSLKYRFRSIGASVLKVVTSRLDLAATEMEDLIVRCVKLFVLLLACALTLALAFFFAALAIVLYIPESSRWLAALACAGSFLGAGLASVVVFRRNWQEMPVPFESTRDVINRDAAALSSPVNNHPTSELDEHAA